MWGSAFPESHMMGTSQVQESFSKKTGGNILYGITILDIVMIKFIPQAGYVMIILGQQVWNRIVLNHSGNMVCLPVGERLLEHNVIL